MPVTQLQFNKLDSLYEYYNSALFNGKLPECIISIWRRNKRFGGAFSSDRWKAQGNDIPIHEIALNANSMDRSEVEVHSTLVHEMVHLFEEMNGHGAKYGYHTRHWGQEMKTVGLYPSNTGAEGGKETGRQMSHYVTPNGKFETAFNALLQEDIRNVIFPYVPLRKDIDEEAKFSRSGVKRAYECPCGCKVWGKEKLQLHCNICGRDFQMM